MERQSAGSDHQTENDGPIGFQLALDPPFALFQQLARQLVDLPLQLDVACNGVAPTGRRPIWQRRR